jgi:hypothetical protein
VERLTGARTTAQLPAQTGPVASLGWHPGIATSVVDLNDDREGRTGYFNAAISGMPLEATDLDIALEPSRKVCLPVKVVSCQEEVRLSIHSKARLHLVTRSVSAYHAAAVAVLIPPSAFCPLPVSF